MTATLPASGQPGLDRLLARARDIAETETKMLLQRTPGSAALYQRAHKILPFGVVSSFQKGFPYPVYVKSGKGSHVWDQDGTEYLDFHGGFGAMVVGHAHPRIVEAISEAANSGTHFAVTTEEAVAYGEELCRRFKLEMLVHQLRDRGHDGCDPGRARGHGAGRRVQDRGVVSRSP